MHYICPPLYLSTIDYLFPPLLEPEHGELLAWVVYVGVGALRKERERRFKGRAKLSFRCGVSRPAPYLALPREVAGNVAMFRLRFGPDKMSLKTRGLLRSESEMCRWCMADREDAEHLLFACILRYGVFDLCTVGV